MLNTTYITNMCNYPSTILDWGGYRQWTQSLVNSPRFSLPSGNKASFPSNSYPKVFKLLAFNYDLANKGPIWFRIRDIGGWGIYSE